MALIIKKVKSENRVYLNRKLVGTVRNFCCGVDLRIKDKPGVLFSILKVKLGSNELSYCVEKLLSCTIPNKSFHWNFNYETAKNDCKMAAFKVALSHV